jgi:hypothetical protein
MEALVILLVPLVAFFVWAVAFFQPKSNDLAAEQQQLDQHIAWLEDRLAYGRQKNWDEQMIGNLTAQLAEARERRAA